MSAATAQAILNEIKPLGSDGYKRILFNHGVQEPFFGVKIEELHNQCQVPFAPDDIRKVEKRGTIGKKRKSAQC